MAIRPTAGGVAFELRNTGRETANPPIVFPSVTPTAHFTWSVWIYCTNPGIGSILNVHSHTDGSQVNLGHDGSTWIFTSREEAVMHPTQYLRSVIFDTWTVIGVTKDGPNFRIFMGIQDPLNTTPWDDPVIIEEMFITSPNIDAVFDYFQLFTTSNSGICNFKFWNYTLTLAEFQAQAQSWDPHATPGPEPFWSSPLRVPGDLSNVQYPYADRNWEHGHAYTRIGPVPGSLAFIFDPAYMANATPAYAWIYPTEFTSVNIDPGLTPLIPTTYKGTQFFRFADVGSIATEDHQIHSVMYYGSAFGGVDPGTPAAETWGLYKDENAVEVADKDSPTYKFTTPGGTGVVIPPGPTSSVTRSNVYAWQFGAQFVWNPVTPQGPTNTAYLAYLLLYIKYTGYPTGITRLPADNMIGLFVINKGGPSVDKYNFGTTVKIPDPTIRTAYIGE